MTVVEVYITVKNTKISTLAQKCFCGEFKSPTKIRSHELFPSLPKSRFSGQIVIKAPSVEFHRCGGMDRLSDKSNLIVAFCDNANAAKNVRYVVTKEERNYRQT